ncbi:site-2 protease family protein, partial [Candidatus Woesearchaeota archaeon]|nr:site-2 protease family protein [Candidatus Woesearchaeota archaeon]
TEAGVQIALPGLLSIPGLGKLGFWHWIISIFVLAVVHEFSHGIVAIAHKFKIKSSGPALFAALIPIIPAAFVEPDEKKLAKASDIKKYSVFAAGPVSNIVTGVIFLLLVMFLLTPIYLNSTEPLGISFNSTNMTVPSYPAFKDMTTYNKVNGRQALDATVLLEEIEKMQPGDVITFANDEVEHSITSVPHPTEPDKPYLGITNINNERRYYNETFGSFFDWLKLLFLWLFFLNFFIGLANLLPLGPVDGGLILRTFLERVFRKNKKFAINLWAGISLFTLLLIIAAFVIPFLLR